MLPSRREDLDDFEFLSVFPKAMPRRVPSSAARAAAAGGAIRSWFNPKARGPSGELLYLDTARFGAADAPNMLV